MHAIYIPQIAQAPQQTIDIEVHDHIPNLETLTPVNGEIKVTHRGNFLDVSARTETIITLTCDRCLQQYNYRLAIRPSEMIWLQDTVESSDDDDLEREVPLEDLVESLPRQGYFDPEEWLYQQLCLEIPQRKLCDANCPGISVPVDSQPAPAKAVDRRWASLESLREQL